MAKGIYKRGNVYWVRYAGLDGKMVFESSRSTKYKNAQALLTKRRNEITEGKQPDVQRIRHNTTFTELCDEYRKFAERQRSYSSKKGFINQLENEFGNLQLRHFTVKILEQFQSKRLSQGIRVLKDETIMSNKPSTVNRLLATLKHMFTKAVEWDMCSEETLKRVRKVKLLEENNRRLRYLSKDECQHLVQCCNEQLRPIVLTALNTGMRRSEILSLTWSQVDLKHGFVHVEQTKNGERRDIPINGTLRETFSNIMRRLDCDYVFISEKTNSRYIDVKRSFHTALKSAKISDFKFHDLRHTFASHLVMSGVDLTTVKELMGHKDIKMTLRYAHLAPSHKVNAVEMLDRTLSDKESQTLKETEKITSTTANS